MALTACRSIVFLIKIWFSFLFFNVILSYVCNSRLKWVSSHHKGKKSHLFVVILFCFGYTCCVEKPTVILNTVAFSQAVVLFCIVSSLFNLFFKKNDIQCFLNIFTPSSFQILLTLLCTIFFFNPQNTFCLLM